MQTLSPDTAALSLRPRWLDGWTLGTLAIAAAVSLPILTVTAYVFAPAGEVWRHLAETVLRDYVSNSIILMLGVGAGTLLIGVPAAWLCSMCVFPGRRLFEWALLLPLAFPAYIIAYTYTGMFDYAGPVQTHLREWFGWGYGDYWFPEVRSLGGAVAMLSLVLYPYVYLLARAAFLEQSVCVLDVGRTLGASPLSAFARIALPMARPAIITGVSLAQMETLADYGTVQYFGISTFTTGIFRTWFGLGDSAAAAQLSALLLGFVFILILFERWSRRKARFHHTSRRYQILPQQRLTGAWRWLAVAACLLPLALGFLLPAAQLAWWTTQTWRETVDAGFFLLVGHTLMLAASAAVITLLLALLLAYGKRLRTNALTRIAVGIASMGYAVPGTVIAVGVLLPFAWIDNTLDAWMRVHVGISTGLLLSGTLAALLFAYAVRFLSVAINTVESGLGRIPPSMDDAARSLGHSPRSVLTRVHVPIMRGTMFTALLLVFVEVMKELPATLILRPFNFNTLAVRAFELASDERLAHSGSASIAIVAAGLIPVILLSTTISHSRPGQRAAR